MPPVASATYAVAIFVKTPGFSSIKTRLAAEAGAAVAASFYSLAVAAVASAVEAAAAADARIRPVWAVAEAGALAEPAWRGFPTIGQGEGGLGERLDAVYRTLLGTHAGVVLIGADSPHLSASVYLDAVARLAAAPGRFVVVPTADGGFSLFGGTRPVPRAAWLAAPYSAPDTLAELERAVAPYGAVTRMPASFDVDTLADLRALTAAMPPEHERTPEQRRLFDWLAAALR